MYFRIYEKRRRIQVCINTFWCLDFVVFLDKSLWADYNQLNRKKARKRRSKQNIDLQREN